MPFVHYWSVGAVNDVPLSMTHAQICNALLADWLPTLPFSASRSVMGWPYYLIQHQSGVTNPYLYIDSISGWSDRQWKGVLSWMVGVAGTRRVLDEEQYVFIAPSSAFYPNNRQHVATPFWHVGYPPSILEITSNPRIKSKLRPDYIAARLGSSGSVEFALVESKGTSRALNNLTSCPTDWRKQARNAVVKLNKSIFSIPRHLVVATRCNPNAVRQKTRQLQVRAWNSNNGEKYQNEDILIEIMSSHYAGLCRNLGLWENLKAIQLATSARIKKYTNAHKSDKIAQNADSELTQLGGWDPLEEGSANFEISLDIGTIHVQVADVAINILRSIRSINSKDSFDSLRQSIGHFNKLKKWYSRIQSRQKEKMDIAIDRSGFIVRAGEMNFMSKI